MLEDYTAEFRKRVLQRAAERNDLDVVAREFGLSPDLVFRWLKDDTESGPSPGEQLSATGRPPVEHASAVTKSSAPAQDGASGIIILVALCLFAPMLLMFAAGSVRLSAEAQRICLPIFILFGCVQFAWLLSRIRRSAKRRNVDLSVGRLVGLAYVCLLLSGISTFMLAVATTAIAHRFVSRPVEVRTTVTARYVYRGKNTSYCLATPTFDSRIKPFDWCTDEATFRRARKGEPIVLHGSTSWFGFMQGDFVLQPDAAN